MNQSVSQSVSQSVLYLFNHFIIHPFISCLLSTCPYNPFHFSLVAIFPHFGSKRFYEIMFYLGKVCYTYTRKLKHKTKRISWYVSSVQLLKTENQKR